jgi:hypothetical protein
MEAFCHPNKQSGKQAGKKNQHTKKREAKNV